MKKVNKLASVMIGNWVCDACLTNAKRKILLGNGSTFFHKFQISRFYISSGNGKNYDVLATLNLIFKSNLSTS